MNRILRGPISSWLVLFALPLAAVAEPPADKSKPAAAEPLHVSFKTSDGVEIVASYYAPDLAGDKDAKHPVAILVHMYPADRQSWKPLAPHLVRAGFAVLAYDIRGTGESVRPKDKKLTEQYERQDPRLFADAWKDAEAAAKWLAGQKNVDADRLVMIGASIGCSISIEYCSRSDKVRGVVCLSPGLDYFGVDTVSHIKQCGKRPILLCAPEAEKQAPEKLARLGQNVTVDIRPGTRARHGTNMFKAEYADDLLKKITDHAVKAVATIADKPAEKPSSDKK